MIDRFPTVSTRSRFRVAFCPLPFVHRGKALAALLAVALALAVVAADARPASYDIEIRKSQRLLLVRSGNEVLRIYRVAWGRGGPGDKQRFGDNKTPVGTYRVVGFNANSRFDFFIRLNYPNVKDAFYGLKNNVISRTDFDRIIDALRAGRVPPQNTRLGGAIGIHGIGLETPEKMRIHHNVNWTEGCIALSNADVHELRSFVGLGTRVVISE